MCIKINIKQIGVVIFHAFSDYVLKILIQHHQEVSTSKAVKRSKDISYSGKMVPKGGRMPAGGRPGDAYVMYSGMSAATTADIDTLFHHAYVSPSFI